METVAQLRVEPRSPLFQLMASSIAATQCQQGNKSKTFIKIRVNRVQSCFSILLMNCKRYRNSGSHYSLSRDEIGSIYLAEKHLKGIYPSHNGDQWGHRGEGVFS